mmetsp:Transcript_111990/g.313121  ORF Transcript_111990/g.313121 Transcript_111990/m.313121 type:complete len:436 (+) Transcript_111990:76-1383(+)
MHRGVEAEDKARDAEEEERCVEDRPEEGVRLPAISGGLAGERQWEPNDTWHDENRAEDLEDLHEERQQEPDDDAECHNAQAHAHVLPLGHRLVSEVRRLDVREEAIQVDGDARAEVDDDGAREEVPDEPLGVARAVRPPVAHGLCDVVLHAGAEAPEAHRARHAAEDAEDGVRGHQGEAHALLVDHVVPHGRQHVRGTEAEEQHREGGEDGGVVDARELRVVRVAGEVHGVRLDAPEHDHQEEDARGDDAEEHDLLERRDAPDEGQAHEDGAAQDDPAPVHGRGAEELQVLADEHEVHGGLPDEGAVDHEGRDPSAEVAVASRADVLDRPHAPLGLLLDGADGLAEDVAEVAGDAATDDGDGDAQGHPDGGEDVRHREHPRANHRRDEVHRRRRSGALAKLEVAQWELLLAPVHGERQGRPADEAANEARVAGHG